MAALALVPCGLVVFAFPALLAIVEVRTGRGYALGITSSVLLAVTIFVVVTVTILARVQPQPTGIHNISATIVLVFYFVPAVYATAIALIAAAIVAGKAGQWWWILGFFVSALAPVLLVVPPQPWVALNIEYVAQQVGFLGMLVAPEAAVLAYSITRHRSGTAPAAARHVAPLK